MALTTQEEARLRALLATIGDGNPVTDLATVSTQSSDAYNSNITGGAITNNEVSLTTRQGRRIEIQGTLPIFPTDGVRQGALDSAIAALNNRLLPIGGTKGQYVTKGDGDSSVWTSFEDTREASLTLGTNLLSAIVPANTAQKFNTRVPVDITGEIEYRLIFQSIGDSSINGYIPALGDTRPVAVMGGAFVFTSEGITITNGFNANLIGIHRVLARGNRGPAGASTRLSDNVLPQELATNGSSRTVIVPPGFSGATSVYIGIQTPANGYNDHQILLPFRVADQNVYRRDGIGFSFPAANTIRADSGADANDKITSWKFAL